MLSRERKRQTNIKIHSKKCCSNRNVQVMWVHRGKNDYFYLRVKHPFKPKKELVTWINKEKKDIATRFKTRED